MKTIKILKRIATLAVLFAIATYLVSLTLNSGRTPEEILRRAYAKESPVFRVAQVLHTEPVPQGQLLFYRNGNGHMACAYVKEALFSHRLAGSSGEILTTAQGSLPANMLYTRLDNTTWIDWGIITNTAVHTVLINGEEAATIETEGLRICYRMGLGKQAQETSAYQFLGTSIA